MASSSLKIKGKRYDLQMEGRLGCCRVTLDNNIRLPPSSEFVAAGNVIPLMSDDVPEFGFVELSSQLLESDCISVTGTFVTEDTLAPLRMMNLSEQVLMFFF